jgi:hypothetical protein
MSTWDGNRWVPESPVSPAPRRSQVTDSVATVAMLIGLVALMIPLQLILAARSNPTLSVSWPGSSVGDSHFVAEGCGFRADDGSYYLVEHGPAPDTASLAYWVDPFPVGSDGCGSATPSWTSSGVTGTFEVYVVRSPSGNPWMARPVTNVVEVDVTSL